MQLNDIVIYFFYSETEKKSRFRQSPLSLLHIAAHVVLCCYILCDQASEKCIWKHLNCLNLERREHSVSVFMCNWYDGLAWRDLASRTAPLEHFVPINIRSGFRVSVYVWEKAAASMSSLNVIRFLHVWRLQHFKIEDLKILLVQFFLFHQKFFLSAISNESINCANVTGCNDISPIYVIRGSFEAWVSKLLLNRNNTLYLDKTVIRVC